MDSWSHSRYVTHAKCPYGAKLQYVDKLPVPSYLQPIEVRDCTRTRRHG
jgi:hypothetical protein